MSPALYFNIFFFLGDLKSPTMNLLLLSYNTFPLLIPLGGSPAPAPFYPL